MNDISIGNQLIAYIYTLISNHLSMKQLILALALTSALFSCKKATTTPNTTPKNTSDSTKVVNDTTKTSNDVSISGFDCAGVKIAGTLTKDKGAFNVTATLTYTGGNGKTYLTKSYTSSGVTGLSATLVAGTLANGEGTLVYTISGSPTSTGTANFAVAFGGGSCVISVKVEDVALTTDITDAEGNTYKTVTIGTQTWMAENLKVSKYSDGTTIPNITDNTQWQNNTTGAWSYYNNDAANNAKYGKLYNWYAVSPTTNGNKNVCPTGWHVPTDAEWTVLTDYLGGESVAGGKMKEVGATSWNSPNTDATNTSLFTGLPGGYRDYDGNYDGIGGLGGWWSSTESGTNDAWGRGLDYGNGNANRDDSGSKRYGLSVRCLRD
jgi:uncharacterized protein (TIGR02145 family)